MLLEETSTMPFKESEVPCKGLFTTVQFKPFLCSIRGLNSAEGAELLVSSPTAQILFAAMATIPESESERLPLMLGLATTFQHVPFHYSTSGRRHLVI